MLLSIGDFVQKADRQLVGVSFWRTKETSNARQRVIVQGKLRVAAAYRRHGLHVIAALRYYVCYQLSKIADCLNTDHNDIDMV
jgi:hypothetical protein